MKKLKCEQCGREHDGSYGSGRFCSESCKQKFIANKPGKKHVCKYCSKEFETSQKLGAHVRNCKLNPNSKIRLEKSVKTRRNNYDERNPIIHVKLVCQSCGNDYEIDVRQDQFDKGQYSHFCSTSCAHMFSGKHADPENIKAGMKTTTKVHIVKCSKCGKDVEVIGSASKILCAECRRETSINPTGKCLICGKNVPYTRKTCCREHELQLRKQTFSKTCQKRHTVGGLRPGGKRACKGWYQGIHCDSSWELAWVIYNLDHGIQFVRNTTIKFPYTFDGSIHNYYPDFLMADGSFVEIKGYVSENWKAKLAAIPNDVTLHVLYKDDIKIFTDYAKEKFGEDFVSVAYSK